MDPGFPFDFIPGIKPADSLQATGAGAQIQIPTTAEETAGIATAENLVIDRVHQLELTTKPTELPKLQMTPFSEVYLKALAEPPSMKPADRSSVGFEHEFGGEAILGFGFQQHGLITRFLDSLPG